MSPAVNNVVVATTINPADQVIYDLCKSKNYNAYCGSEEDVFGRTLNAAECFNADIIVDVTSDCPFVNPEHITHLVDIVKRGPAVYASNVIERTFPDGLDVQVYTRAAFKELGTFRGINREHSGYNFVLPCGDKFDRVSVIAPLPFHHPEWRLTLDTAEDLKVLRNIYYRWIQHNSCSFGFSTNALVLWLQRHPEVLTNLEVKSTTPGLAKENDIQNTPRMEAVIAKGLRKCLSPEDRMLVDNALAELKTIRSVYSERVFTSAVMLLVSDIMERA